MATLPNNPMPSQDLQPQVHTAHPTLQVRHQMKANKEGLSSTLHYHHTSLSTHRSHGVRISSSSNNSPQILFEPTPLLWLLPPSRTHIRHRKTTAFQVNR